MRQLVGIEDRPHRNDEAISDLELLYSSHTPVGPVVDDAWLAVDRRDLVRDASLEHHRAPADERLRDAQRTDERLADRGGLPATVAVERRVWRKHGHERVRVACLPGLDEEAGDLLALRARDFEAPPPLVHVRVRSGEDLARVRG